MSQDYLKLIEEHRKESTINLFEKVLITAQRAKSLYELDEPAKAALPHKPTFQAILETNEGSIVPLREAQTPGASKKVKSAESS
ncbi:MAG: hypothetical protein CL923_02360 [Deltaproteobacteria bacterium]|jgi:DNA-directed RNA polymerase subunit K/omega|nr:hypothetical protein [Deltaproteobacteria bacterium]MDP7158885.1 DNA-directed RNA polymerase subunit omega [SAR324 cluster bacterium]MBQ31392.1 hypothetical protein [Deltaproteobacteria bacterium]MDP7318892.1 DNA-directed RNA polymerase subunit omega [SAR324 cluster bacterium]MDP7463449.1 DNA-directed RNA polymerase subunit omega [SAR324 cluster bacterium]